MRNYLFLVPVKKHGINAELRQKGKIATLACGYNGSVGALNTNATTTARIRRAKEATRASCQVRLCEKIVNTFVKPVEGYHQVKRCSVNEFILGGAVALGETAHRVPVSGQAVVVQSSQQHLGMLGIIHSHPTLTKQLDLFTVGLELLHLLQAHPCLIRKTKTGPGLPPRRAAEPVMLATRLPG